ncbi:macro domain-containing protein [Athalassotoga saccharophila]|uniref:macro domain-containing protein n=1 Tax=Athalassotoga saccharophila TaxID=1441386 RepID=UPI00137A6A15|nr:macro domain-containing protein [Athalassotoga saccharophila]BBJ28663.1 hypothetical protein ATHSA_1582 [Athalassotoga saccharophila]
MSIILSPYSVFEFIEEKDMVVNTINTKGYMGKGLAKEFAIRFPEMEKEYIKKCEKNEIKSGDLWVWEGKNIVIGNMATKDDYKLPSKIEWISKGIENLRHEILSRKLKSVAIPKIGASLGHLDWEHVEKEILKLHDLECEIIIAIDAEIGPKEQKALEKISDLVSRCSSENSPFFDYDCPKEIIKVIKLVKENQNKIKRFRDILNIRGIGDKNYKMLIDIASK